MGYSIHAGMVVVADGTADSDWRLTRVLNSDPGMGIIRHADAGYEKSQDIARDAFAKRGCSIPML
jgi:urocanate hydratase